MAASLENLDEDAIKGLATLAKGLAEDPKTRRAFQALLKTQNPSLPIPELDAETRAAAQIKPLQDELAALRKEQAEKRGVDGLQARRAKLREAGHSDEEITSIEKLMVDKQIPSHDTAAEHFRMSQKLATPTPSILRQNTLPVAGKDVKEAGGIRKWAITEASKAADDIKAGRVKFH